MEDLRKYTRKSELYKLSAEEQTEKMKLVMKEVEKISAYTGVSEEAAYNLFLNGYDVPSELDGQKIAFSESELTPDLLSNLAENNVRSVKVMSDESISFRQSTTSIGAAHRMGVGECHTTYWFLIYSCTICKLFSLTVVTK